MADPMPGPSRSPSLCGNSMWCNDTAMAQWVHVTNPHYNIRSPTVT